MAKVQKKSKSTKKKSAAKQKAVGRVRKSNTAQVVERNVRKEPADKDAQKEFGTFLKRLRRADEPQFQAGATTKSQDDVVQASEEKGRPISKSTLSLYEQGKVQNTRPKYGGPMIDAFRRPLLPPGVFDRHRTQLAQWRQANHPGERCTRRCRPVL